MIRHDFTRIEKEYDDKGNVSGVWKLWFLREEITKIVAIKRIK